MDSKIHKKSIFESGFDSFEFDDGFLIKLDSDLKKSKSCETQYVEKKLNTKAVENQSCIQEKKDKNIQYYDLPLFIEDLNESDFFDLSNNKNKKHSSKITNNHKNETSRKTSLTNNFVSCLSPIQGPKSTVHNLSSSTPVKPNSNSQEKHTSQGNSIKNIEYAYLEADLFEDWDVNEFKTEQTPKSTVTLSQALKLIEEAESAKESDQKESLNQSIDLLTGEVVCADMGVMFDESFGVPGSIGKKQEDAESSSDSVIVVEESKASKPAAAQKLNFESDKVSCFNMAAAKENNFGGIFSSDDDFDFLTQDLLDKPKEFPKCAKPNSQFSGGKRSKPLKHDLNDSTDTGVSFRKRKGCFKVIESDTTEDSPSPKFRRQTKTKVKKRKNQKENVGKEFIESEAEVSDEVEVSSDEAEEDGEYDRSFLDEESYFTQNCSANMTSKYLESVKGVSVPGRFKIPAPKSYSPVDVFSQIPEENDAEYEIDSFCVNDVEEEMKTDLSDLEVAEKILEMDRKKRKRKRYQKFRK